MKRGAVSAHPGKATLPATPNSLHKCHENIRNMIIRGLLAPGSRIVEGELAERLEVSRTPVRGALHILQREGYVISSRNGHRKMNLIVAPLTKQDAVELFRIVARLEGLAARSAAELDAASRRTLGLNLRRINDNLGELAGGSKNEPNLIFEVDMTFHQLIADAGSGPRLRSLHASIKPQTERYMRLYAGVILDQLKTSVREHSVILRAIENGDADRAEEAIEFNWENGAQRLGGIIDALGERGSWYPQ